MKTVLALGLDPAVADPASFPGVTAEQIKAFIEVQLQRVRLAGYEVVSCLVDRGATAEMLLSQHLEARKFDCVVIGAGLRAPDCLLLFEKLLNLVHRGAPHARICFNTTPADTAEAIKRWI